MNTVACFAAHWVVRGFLEILDVYFNPDVTHALVASDSSLSIMISLVVKHDLYDKRLMSKRPSSTIRSRTKYGAGSMLAMYIPSDFRLQNHANCCPP